MKHNHAFAVGEKVWDDENHEWARVVRVGGELPEEGGNLILLEAPDGRGMTWLTAIDSVYQIAPNLRTACSGDIVCYEHNETQDNYPYYCPAREENFFAVELIETYEADTPEGTAGELIRKLQDAVQASKNLGISVCVEDENGRLEYIEHIWYDNEMNMIRMSLRGVVFEDVTQE